MATYERGLGKGLELLLGEESLAPGEGKKSVPLRGAAITTLPIASLLPNKSQPRKRFDHVSLEELALSIRSQGVVQPVLVRPFKVKGEDGLYYEIVAGERRWRAARMAGLKEVPVYIKDFSDDEALTAALIENLQREDLNPIEEAVAIYNLLKKLSIGQDSLAMKLGKSRSSLTNSLRLLKLEDEIQEYIQKGFVTSGHARALLALPDKDLRQALCTAILEQDLSVRDAEAAVAHWRGKGSFPFNVNVGSENFSLEKAKKGGVKVKPMIIKKIISQLRAAIHPKITIAGTESMGRITLPYESKEQLLFLIQRLGVKDKSAGAQ